MSQVSSPSSFPWFRRLLMPRGDRGSTTTPTPVPTPAQLRRSTRNGRGTGGRDVQLDQLGDILVATTRQRKRRFVPDDADSLPVNPCAPVQKKRRRKNKARWYTAQHLQTLMDELGISHSCFRGHTELATAAAIATATTAAITIATAAAIATATATAIATAATAAIATAATTVVMLIDSTPSQLSVRVFSPIRTPTPSTGVSFT